MIKEQDLYGIYVPVITPFLQNGEMDYKSFTGHIKSLVVSGIHGLVNTSFMEGDIHQAKQTFDQLLPLIHLLFKESNPAPLKWLLARQGVIESDTLRLPMNSISYSLQQELDPFH